MVLDTAIPLAGILRAHRDWIENPANGQRADLSGLTLNEIKLSGENLQRALLIGVTMLDADLTGADFGAANLDRADLQRSNLAGANLTGAELGSTRFAGGWMAGIQMSEAKAT